MYAESAIVHDPAQREANRIANLEDEKKVNSRIGQHSPPPNWSPSLEVAASPVTRVGCCIGR